MGAWAGSVVHSVLKGLAVLLTEERWQKTRAMVCEVKKVFESRGVFNAKEFESQTGFLVYVAQTY